MTKNRVTRGIQAAVLVFAVVLTGCASAPTNSGGGGTSGNNEAAAQLVKDLNAAKAGGTVTLSGWAGLNTALTVPEGVILDLTQEGAALELQDGAVLTVNGTVRTTGHGDHGKGWVAGSLRVGDGAAVINGSGTIKLTSKGRLLNIGSDRAKRQLTLDGVTLAGLPDNDSSLVGIGENSAFILKSGAITGNTYTSDKGAGGGGVEVYKGTFTMEGGAISGNSAEGKEGSSGGGVNIGEEAVFTLSGGTITGNTARNGGGVSVYKGTFTMEGGAISGNTALGGTENSNGVGGGVNIGNGSTFIMTGGAISGNSASGTRGAIGGGVRVDGEGAMFTMTGGEISRNSATGKNWSHGGGVCADKGSSFIMQGGTISANTAAPGSDGGGGGVKVMNGSAFIMEGGTIYGKAGSLPAGTDASLANSAQSGASLYMGGGGATNTAKWGTGGAYTKGGVPQSGGSNIGDTNDTLIAVPAK